MQKSLDRSFLIRLFHLHAIIHAFEMLRSSQANCYFRAPRFQLFQTIQQKFKHKQYALFYNILYTFKRQILIGGFIAILFAIISLSIPELLKSFMNFINNPESQSQINILGKNFFKTIFGIQFLRIIVAHHRRRKFHQLSIKIQSILCKKLVTKSFKMSREDRQKIPRSQIINLQHVDSKLAANLIKRLYLFFEVPFTVVVTILLLFNYKGAYGFIGIYWFVIAILIQYELNIKMAHCNQTKLGLIQQRSKNNIEIMENIKEAKIIGWQDVLLQKNNDFFQEENADHRKFYKFSTLYDISVLILPMAVTVSICLHNASQHANLSVVEIYSILALLNICLPSTLKLKLFYIALHDGLYSFKRFQWYFNIPDGNDPKRFSCKNIGIQQELVIKAGTQAIYKSKENQYLFRVNEHIEGKGGQRLLILGRKDQGQSFFVDLLLGRLDTAQGQVLVNGTISYMPKQQFFIRKSVYQNIRFYDDRITNQEIEKFAINLNLIKHHNITELREFLNKKMDQVNTFTKSQQAKIALIRTLIRKADIYILNEPFEELNKENVRFADVVLRKLQNQGKLIIIAPFTLNYISEKDKIIIIESGQVTQFGTLEQLSKNAVSNIRNFVNIQNQQVNANQLANQETIQQAQKGIQKLKQFFDKKRVLGIFRKNAQQEKAKEKQQSEKFSETFSGQILKQVFENFHPQPYLRKSVQWHLQQKPSPMSLDIQKKFAFCAKMFVQVVPYTEVFFILLVIAAAEFLHIFIHYSIGHINQHDTFSQNTRVIFIQLSLTIGLAFVLYYEGEISSMIAIIQGNILYENSLKTVIYKNLNWLRNQYPIRLAQKFNNDYQQIFIACHKLLSIYKNVIILGITIYFITEDNIMLIGVFLLLAAIYLTIFLIYREIQLRVYQYHYHYKYRFLKVVEESFEGAQVFISFNKTQEHIKSTQQQFKISCSFKLATQYNRVGLDLLCDSIGAILLVLIISQGIKYKSTHEVTNLPLIATSLHLLMNGSNILKSLVKDSISFKSFFSMKLVPFMSIIKKDEINKYQSTLKAKNERYIHFWDIKFDNIQLAYQDDKTIHSPLNLSIKQGQHVLIYELEDICRQYILLALTMNLSQLFYPGKNKIGKVTIGQIDITTIDIIELRKNIGVIAKKNFYICGTLRQNICRKYKYQDIEIIRYVKLLNLDKDFQHYEKDLLDTKIEFELGKINHEITKKLAIIRSLLRKPKIIILYDTTIFIENIDIVHFLKKCIPGCTIICLSSLIQNYIGFERIVYMKNFHTLEDKKTQEVVGKVDTLIGRIIKNSNINAYNYMNKISPESKFRKKSL